MYGQNPPDTTTLPERPAKAILVLGAAVRPGGAPSPTLARRTGHAAALWHAQAGSVVVPCGGLGRHPPAEAAVMASLLTKLGVPDAVIHPEAQSTSTAQNIRNARVILEGLGLDHVLIVSDGYHLPRARLLARRAGLRAETSAPSVSGARLGPQLRGALREVPAYLVALSGFSR